MHVDVLVASRDGKEWRRFLWHFGEMLLVMMVGMCVLGAAARGLYVLLSGESFVLRQHITLAALVMAFNMTLPMVLWMRFRGHSWERGGEMGLAMFVPTVIALALFWVGPLGAGAVLGAAMILMVPAMLAVMLYRRDEYSAPHRAHARRRRWFASAK